MRFSSAKSSFRLFWRGVHTTSNRPHEMKVRTIWLRSKLTFLMRCVSSMTIYSKLNFLNTEVSIRHTSQLHFKILWDEPARDDLRVLFIGFGEDHYIEVRVHFSNSHVRFCRFGLGMTIRCGPEMEVVFEIGEEGAHLEGFQRPYGR